MQTFTIQEASCRQLMRYLFMPVENTHTNLFLSHFKAKGPALLKLKMHYSFIQCDNRLTTFSLSRLDGFFVNSMEIFKKKITQTQMHSVDYAAACAQWVIFFLGGPNACLYTALDFLAENRNLLSLFYSISSLPPLPLFLSLIYYFSLQGGGKDCCNN